MKRWSVFVRNKRSSILLDRFLIASVASVLVIRFYLAATGYPQVGGGGLHISHMLWGGLSMLIALLLSLAFLGRQTQSIAVILGGAGFGAFIDELGKFITSDNNYFFRPTLALIYLIFIILLLSFRIFKGSSFVSEQEHLANALHILEGQAYDLREQDKKEILLLLRARNSQDLHLNLLANAVECMPIVPDLPPGLLEKIFRATRSLCQRLVDAPQFAPVIALFFIGYALLLAVFEAVNLKVGSVTTGAVEIGWFASSLLTGSMILIGVLSLRRTRLATYTWFKRAILVSIFLTQVFLLYTQPMAALEALLLDLIVLAVLDTFISQQIDV